MLWKIYVFIFALINILSLISFDYNFINFIALLSLILSVFLNIAVFSYAFKKSLFSRNILNVIFKLNIGLIGLFVLFELITLLQEMVGVGISLPTSGLVSIIAGFPALPALYATYKLSSLKPAKKRRGR